MDTIVQWATIFSPIIAVLLAWWTSRSSAKDTAKQIAALEASTNRQVESIKNLAKIQIELSSMQIDKEIWDARHRLLQTMKKEDDAIVNRFELLDYQNNEAVSRIQEQKEKTNNLFYESEYYDRQIKTLNMYVKRLETIKYELASC